MTYGLCPPRGTGTMPPAFGTGTTNMTPLRLWAGANPADGAGDAEAAGGAVGGALAPCAAAEAVAVVVAAEGGKPATAPWGGAVKAASADA